VKKRTCAGPECDRPAKCRGFCPAHYQQWRTRKGVPLTPVRAYAGNGGVGLVKACSFPGCARPLKARGMCHRHWIHLRKYGEAREIRALNLVGRTCGIAGCAEPATAKLRCPKHLQWGYNLSRFGITLEDFVRMSEEQGGVCAICGGVNANGKALSVDHDHACCAGDRSCGVCVRGLLCQPCNFATGLMRDDPDRLRAAAVYIESHRVLV
jgi:hypothetical protein